MLFTSLGLVRIGKKLCPPSCVLPFLPQSFEEGKAPKQCTVSVTPIYQPCEQGVSSFCFLSFLGFFLVVVVVVLGGGEESGAKGKGGNRCHLTSVIFP